MIYENYVMCTCVTLSGKVFHSSDVALFPFGLTIARQKNNSDSDVVPDSNQIQD